MGSADWAQIPHVTVIGWKTDPFCFSFFPQNDSIPTLCYRSQDSTGKWYDIEKEATRTDYNVKLVGLFSHFPNITAKIMQAPRCIHPLLPRPPLSHLHPTPPPTLPPPTLSSTPPTSPTYPPTHPLTLLPIHQPTATHHPKAIEIATTAAPSAHTARRSTGKCGFATTSG